MRRRPLPGRIRWDNVAKLVAVLSVVALVVAWPRLEQAPPPVPAGRPEPVAETPRPPARSGSVRARGAPSRPGVERWAVKRRRDRAAKERRAVKRRRDRAAKEQRAAKERRGKHLRRAPEKRARAETPAPATPPAPAPAPPSPSPPTPASAAAREFGID